MSAEWQFLIALNEQLGPLKDPAAIMETAVRLLGQHLGASRVHYAAIESDEFVIRRYYTDGVTPLPARAPLTMFSDSIVEACRNGETVVVDDFGTDARFTDQERARFLAHNVAALVGVPLIKGGRWLASFGVHSATPRNWTKDQIALVEITADRTWSSGERVRAEEALGRSEGRQAFMRRLNETIRALADPAHILEEACRLIGTHLSVNRVVYAEINGDDGVIVHDYVDGVPSMAGPVKWRSLVGSRTAEILEGWPLSVNDTSAESHTPEERAALDSAGIRAYVSPLLIKDGRFVGAFSVHSKAPRAWTPDEITLVQEVADRIWATLEHRKAEAELRANQERLRLAIDATAGGSWMWDLRTNETHWDDAFRARFGFTPEEPAVFETWLTRVHVEDRARMRRGLEEILEGKDRWDDTYRMVRPGSEVRWMQSLGRADRDDTGVVTRLTGLELDITERRQIEDALQARFAKTLQERTAELEYRTTQLSQMAWDLTLAEHQAREELAKTLHDGLQQLLVIVALNLELQQKREAEAGNAPSELLAEAKQQIDEALDVARSLNIELFPPVLQRAGLPTALTWLAKWTYDKYKMRVEIDADPRADSPRKDIRTLIFESVRELLFNAVKYAQTDRVKLALRLDDDDRLCITVTDQGIGFSPSRLDDRSRPVPVGWGLFRIRERLSLLGGNLDIDSAPGRGTRVRLVAPRGGHDPIADLSESNVTRSGAAPAVDDDRISPDALRILIVDDHPAVRRALREMLHQRPQLAVVGDSANGFEAIAHANTLRPDVILMDIAMPHMDGVEATARIRAELPDIRILGLSTLARSETADAIEQAGAAGFFVKGTDTRRLIEQLLAYHAERNAGAQARS